VNFSWYNDISNQILKLLFALAHQGYRWGEENDEDYGKSLHDNFNSSAHPPYAPAPFYPTEYR
jgi:hypothetical protein